MNHNGPANDPCDPASLPATAAAARRMDAGEQAARALLRKALTAGDHTPIAAAIVELAGQDHDVADGMADVLARAALAGAPAVLALDDCAPVITAVAHAMPG